MIWGHSLHVTSNIQLGWSLSPRTARLRRPPRCHPRHDQHDQRKELKWPSHFLQNEYEDDEGVTSRGKREMVPASSWFDGVIEETE
jgi:hypothetical protein